ncbi:hypothetical protein AB0L65_53115 [Nonomuraea sp. NPDC052116]|uniref:hypothetical protein n=1 Tax=Nonomuraea sp. NPDC052116 TaxID=3155665 RepID=UPI003418D91A
MVVLTACAGLTLLAGQASATPRIIKTYPLTTACMRACQIDLKTAPSGYYCGRAYSVYALMVGT